MEKELAKQFTSQLSNIYGLCMEVLGLLAVEKSRTKISEFSLMRIDIATENLRHMDTLIAKLEDLIQKNIKF